MKNITTSLGFRLTVASYLVVAIFMSVAGITVYRVSKDSIKMGAMAMVNRMAEELALVPSAPPEELGDRLQRVKVRKSGSTWIMDKDGNLLYNPDPLFREEYIVKKKNFGNIQVVLQAASPRASGQGSFKEKLVDLLKYEEGFGTYRQFGEERILAFRTLPGRGLLIGVDEPVSSANSELERIKKFISYTALVSALLIMAFNLLSIRIIIKPYYREMEDLNASLQHSNEQLEDLNGKLAVSNRNLTTLYDVGLGLRHSLALRDILALIVNGAHQVLDVDRIAVFLPAPDGKSLELRSLAGDAHAGSCGQGAAGDPGRGAGRLVPAQGAGPPRGGPEDSAEPASRAAGFDRAVPALAGLCRRSARREGPRGRGDRRRQQVAARPDQRGAGEPAGHFRQPGRRRRRQRPPLRAAAPENNRARLPGRSALDPAPDRQLDAAGHHPPGGARLHSARRPRGDRVFPGRRRSRSTARRACSRASWASGWTTPRSRRSGCRSARRRTCWSWPPPRKAPVGIVHFGRAGLGELIGTALEDGTWRESVGNEVPGARAAVVAVPLIAREEVVGVIGVVRTEPALIRRHEIELLLLYANTAALTVERAELYARMHKSMESLEITDHVSRLFTLQYGQQRTREELARCEAAGLAFAGLLIGIDDFKDYNDRCGQDLGDRSLAEIGEMVKSSLRGGDIAFRYGGRLIAVALPGASREQAALIADGIRDRVQRHRFPGPGGQRDQAITLSIGLEAWAVGARPAEAADIFKVVLGRLHRAESDGGNRVYASEG